jgi:hypothetical protein
MLQTALISIVVAVVAYLAWYSSFLHLNRRRGLRILRWLRRTVAPHGQLEEAEWTGPSRFRGRLKLSGREFLQPLLEVCLAPRHMPLQWALWRWRGIPETVSFQANLLCPPSQTLDIRRNSWTNLASRPIKEGRNWSTHRVATLYLSTQPTWETQIAERMSGALAIRDFDYLTVSFRRSQPHFTVTFSLQEAMKQPCGQLTIFDNLRELAEGPHTSRM